jgi:hypothetical protein
MSLFGDYGSGSTKTATNGGGVTVTQVQEAKNAQGQPIKLAVAYDDKVHNEVHNLLILSLQMY